MIRSLFIIGAAGLVLAIACFAGAAALGGRDVVRNGWSINGDGWRLIHDVTWDDEDEDIVTRQIDWDGGEALTFDLSARVIYAQAETPSITVTAPSETADRVRFEDGRFTFDTEGRNTGVRSRPRITVMGPAVSSFTLNGSQDLEIRDYDQPALAVNVNGSGEVDGWGRTQTLTVAVTGSGEAELNNLQAADAIITVNGSGDVIASASGHARVQISGSGDVEFVTRPARLDSQVSGSGQVRQPD